MYKEIIERFPDLELSYDYVDHTKASKFDYYMAIPYGKKYFIWFTYYEGKRTCFLINKNKDNEIVEIDKILTINNDDLHFGTILYGTLITYEGFRYFVTQNVFMYKNKLLNSSKNYEKMNILSQLFENDIQQKIYLSTQIILSLPVMSYQYNEMIEQCKKLVYDIYDIQCLNKQYHKPVYISYRERKGQDILRNKHKAIFNIRADVQNDIYNLYCYNEGSFNYFYGNAYIPSYKSSKFINSLFRKIKENENLDYLEESDDEDEFEDTRLDKYVDLDLELKMECEYSNKFKKWIPIKLSHQKLSSIIDIKNMFHSNPYVEKKNQIKFRKFKKKY